MNANSVPRRPEKIAEDKPLAGPLWCSCISLRISRPTTGGVSTTAKAKLKLSAGTLATPANIPAEIVAPERENPRKQRQRSCTAPIRQAWRSFNSGLSRTRTFWLCRFSTMPATSINGPAIAKAGAIISRWLNRSSMSACGAFRNRVFFTSLIQTSPVTAVRPAATTAR